MHFISELLDEGHVLSSFACGKEPLDRWLRTSAIRGNAQDTGRTWVIHEGDRVVVGYYTLAGHVLHRNALPRTQARSVPEEVSAILLAKLALDISLQGQGLGVNLLLEALSKCVASNSIVASRYVLVDAIDDGAARFYEKYGFTRLPETSGTTRLYRRLKDIAADLSDGAAEM